MDINQYLFFTSEQGNILVRLLIAHIISDFVFQTSAMVKNKGWLSLPMFAHIGIVFLATGILSGYWVASLIIAIIHYGIDGSKMTLQKYFPSKGFSLFMLDQVLHVLVIVGSWAWTFNIWTVCAQVLSLPITHYTFSLLVLAYLLVSTPVGFIIKYATSHIASHHLHQSDTQEVSVENVGKLIGIFERIIILTFVLLNQYEAIGFLITGKSIIRFADKNSDLRSEYVLVGTMMSYALAILVGVFTKWLLAI